MVESVDDARESAIAEAADRLRRVVMDSGGPKRVAAGTGITLRTLHAYLRGETEIRLSALVAVANYCNASVEWLATGREPAAELSQSQSQAVQARSFPVIALAACGLESWYVEDEMSVDAQLRLDDPEAFAVLATGSSLWPEGVRHGFLCFCAPSYTRKRGDIVFIERHDRTAALKRLVSEDAEWVVVEGWFPPEEGTQRPFREELKRAYLRRLAPVVYVKRKL